MKKRFRTFPQDFYDRLEIYCLLDTIPKVFLSETQIFATTSVQFFCLSERRDYVLFIFISIRVQDSEKRVNSEREKEERTFDILLEATLVCLQTFTNVSLHKSMHVNALHLVDANRYPIARCRAC